MNIKYSLLKSILNGKAQSYIDQFTSKPFLFLTNPLLRFKYFFIFQFRTTANSVYTRYAYKHLFII